MTPRQSQLLRYIRSYTAAMGIPPSYAEMATALGLVSKSNITQLVGKLERDGHLRRGRKGTARSIEVLPRGEALVAELVAALRGCVEAMEECNVGNTVPGMNRLIAAREAIAKAEALT